MKKIDATFIDFRELKEVKVILNPQLPMHATFKVKNGFWRKLFTGKIYRNEIKPAMFWINGILACNNHSWREIEKRFDEKCWGAK